MMLRMRKRLALGLGMVMAGVLMNGARGAEPSGGLHLYFDGEADPNSHYGRYWFPEPIRGEEGDVDRELRLDWFHQEKRNSQMDDGTAEVAWNFKMLTLELEVPYHSERSVSVDDQGVETRDSLSGVGNISISARHPILGYVSPDGFFDYTLVGALELGIPSGSEVREDFEYVPSIRQLFVFADHLSIQTSIGYSQHVGNRDRGASAMEYSAVFGYTLTHDELPIPGVLSTTPLFELKGDLGLSKEDRGVNSLQATIGIRINLESIGPGQPRIGIGYTFPLDFGARQESDWGLTFSLIYEF
jgi:hypothetical protein